MQFLTHFILKKKKQQKINGEIFFYVWKDM